MSNKQMLDIYSDYLLASFSYTTATGLSRLTGNTISHDQVTRFLSSEMKTSKDSWLLVKPFQRRIQSSTGVLILDDSVEEKPYTDENDIICWHYDHSRAAPCQRHQLHRLFVSEQGCFLAD